MRWRRNRWAVAVAAAAALALVSAACGRSAGSPASGNVSATNGLVATTPAGTKAVSSVTAGPAGSTLFGRCTLADHRCAQAAIGR